MNALFLRRNISKKLIMEEEETPKQPLLSSITPEEEPDEPEEEQIEEPLEEPKEIKTKTDEEIEEQISVLKHTLHRRRSSIPYMGEIKIVDETIEIKRIEIPVEQPKKKIVPKYRS